MSMNPAPDAWQITEQRVREIALEVALAVNRTQAAKAACQTIDRYRVSRAEVEEALAGSVRLDV
jgi:hypothetical protein